MSGFELKGCRKEAGFACGCGCGKESVEEHQATGLKVLLTGNPNCGKSTIFNRLCGLHVRTGNYPGVTIERISGMHHGTEIIDTPGVFSLSAATVEEKVAIEELRHHEANLILNIVDGNTLERSLYLTTELLSLERPMVVLLNMWDTLKGNGKTIDAIALEKKLGVRVIPLSATGDIGWRELEDLLKNPCAARPKPILPHNEALRTGYEKLVSCALEQGVLQPYFVASSLLGNEAQMTDLSSELKSCQQEVISVLRKSEQDDVFTKLMTDRYEAIEDIVQAVQKQEKVTTLTEYLDRIVLNRYLAFPIFLLIMGFVYFVSVSWLGTIVTDWTNDEFFGEMVQPYFEELLTEHAAPEWLVSLVGNGIIGGVGAVLGFVPQMVILFLLLTLLEQCGYMTRAAFVLERVFALFGLSGRAFIPYLIGSGCGVPALMTARTLGSESERRLVLFTATMIPCGAKLPVIIVFASAIFADYPFFASGMYILSIFVIMMAARILGKFSAFKTESNPMLLDLPTWHLPSLRITASIVYSRCALFVKKAGTVILGSVLVIWTLTSYSFHGDGFISWIGEDGDQETSIMADIASPGAVLLEPIGSGTWQAFVSSVAGLVAKENLVSAMATVTGFDSEEDEGFEDKLLPSMFGGDIWAAFAFVIFNLFTLPCFAAIGVMRRELGSRILFAKAVGFVLLYSYSLAFVIYRLGLVVINGRIDAWTVAAFTVVLGFIYLLFFKRGSTVSEKISFVMTD